jgi:hypothetical protein
MNTTQIIIANIVLYYIQYEYLEPEVVKNNSFRIIVGIVILCVVLGLGGVFLQQYLHTEKKTVRVFTGVDRGMLYYSATRVGEDESHLFELNLNTKKTTLLSNTEGIYQITPLKKGTEATSYIEKDGKSVIELIVTDANGVKEVSYIESPVVSGRIGRMAWNDDRTVLLYESVPVISSTSSTKVTDGVSIYAYNVAKKSNTFLTEGHNPTFYNDTTFLFLRDDGVYVFDVTDDESLIAYTPKLVSAFDGLKAMDKSNMLFSPDKKILFATHPHESQVELYTVVSSERQEVTLSKQGNRSESMISPLHSPDGGSLVFFEEEVATSSREMMISTVDRKTGKKVNEYAVMLDSTKPFVISFWK